MELNYFFVNILIKNNQISNPLGDRLREARESQGISLSKASKDLGIAIKYLEAIENNCPNKLPGEEYFNFFLKKYCLYLKLDYLILKELINKNSVKTLNSKCKSTNFFSWHKFNRFFFSFFVVVALLSFLFWNIEAIFRPPELEIFSPTDGIITFERQLKVEGRTAKEAEVFINNFPVLVDSNGNFNALVDLQKGLNLIKISAKKRYSRLSIVEIRVLFNEITID